MGRQFCDRHCYFSLKGTFSMHTSCWQSKGSHMLTLTISFIQTFTKQCNFLDYLVPACVLSHFSRVRLFAALWTVAHSSPLSVGFSRQEYWSGLPFPSPGDLPHPGINPGLPALQSDSLPSKPSGKPISSKTSFFPVGDFPSSLLQWQPLILLC